MTLRLVNIHLSTFMGSTQLQSLCSSLFQFGDVVDHFHGSIFGGIASCLAVGRCDGFAVSAAAESQIGTQIHQGLETGFGVQCAGVLSRCEALAVLGIYVEVMARSAQLSHDSLHGSRIVQFDGVLKETGVDFGAGSELNGAV